jgi:hypothetical protein
MPNLRGRKSLNLRWKNWLEMSEVESVEVDYVETVEEMGEG